MLHVAAQLIQKTMKRIMQESGSTGEKIYKIGITQYMDHPSLNAATDGFKKAIEDSGLNVEYDYKMLQVITV